MATALAPQTLFRNELLSRVPQDEMEQLAPHLSLLPFGLGNVLVQPEKEVEFVYFPESMIGSVVAIPNGERIEAVSVGREGFIGIPAILEGTTLTQTIVQIAGDGYRVSATQFKLLLTTMPKLKSMIDAYILITLDEVSLTAACNRAHPLSERCAKWLLLVRDRHDEEVFLLTHKFLATMLGVRRAGVTVAAGILQKAGIIRYSRGRVTILDQNALEEAACECYATIRKLRVDARDRLAPVVRAAPLRARLTAI
jgi:CRP-like cAMP-binding protein